MTVPPADDPIVLPYPHPGRNWGTPLLNVFQVIATLLAGSVLAEDHVGGLTRGLAYAIVAVIGLGLVWVLWTNPRDLRRAKANHEYLAARQREGRL